jgi:hypothetical protein
VEGVDMSTVTRRREEIENVTVTRLTTRNLKDARHPEIAGFRSMRASVFCS